MLYGPNRLRETTESHSLVNPVPIVPRPGLRTHTANVNLLSSMYSSIRTYTSLGTQGKYKITLQGSTVASYTITVGRTRRNKYEYKKDKLCHYTVLFVSMWLAKSMHPSIFIQHSYLRIPRKLCVHGISLICVKSLSG